VRRPCGVVAVAYADVGDIAEVLPAIAARIGAIGVLLDTADKNGPGLGVLMPPERLSRWVDHARHAALFVALAGRLVEYDLPVVAAAGADIAGVRGAVCDGGRTGRVAVERVRQCRMACVTSAELVRSP
jgi:dihydroneopterin aldolase